jgi:transcriptional regulator with XRE-family HTH domain
MEKRGHPGWKDEQGEPLLHVSNAEFSRRTGIPTSYLNAIKHPERSGNADIGAAKLALVADGVGIDIRFFFDGYKGERDFMIYLLAHKREQKQADEATQNELAKLRSEMVAMVSGVRGDIATLMQAHQGEVQELKGKLMAAQAYGQTAEASLHRLESEHKKLLNELRTVRAAKR